MPLIVCYDVTTRRSTNYLQDCNYSMFELRWLFFLLFAIGNFDNYLNVSKFTVYVGFNSFFPCRLRRRVVEIIMISLVCVCAMNWCCGFWLHFEAAHGMHV